MEHLYFVALLPPETIAEEITAIKKDFSAQYGPVRALRTLPHITLIPPFLRDEAAAMQPAEILNGFSGMVKPFEIVLKGYDHFETGVLYIKAVHSRELLRMHEKLVYAFRQAGFSSSEAPARFHPHITIAYRDLKPETFRKAWPEYIYRKYNAAFDVRSIYLLRHNTRAWEILSEHPLRDTGAAADQLRLF